MNRLNISYGNNQEAIFYWETINETIPIFTTTVTTDQDGAAIAAFSPPEGGIYQIFASATDANDQVIRASLFTWVSGPGYINWGQEDHNRLVISEWRLAEGEWQTAGGQWSRATGQSHDAGQSWQPSGAGLTYMGIEEVLFSPGFAEDHTTFARTGDESLYRSTDGGNTWEKLASPVAHLVLSPAFTQDQTLLGWDYNTRLYRSNDGGTSWTFVNMLPQGVRQVSLAPSFPQSQLLFAYGFAHNKSSLYRSTDGGYSDAIALRGSFTLEQLLQAGLNQPMFLLASRRDKSTNPPALRKTVYRSPDEGLTWIPLELPDDLIPTVLAVSPDFATDQTLWLGTADGRVVRWQVSP